MRVPSIITKSVAYVGYRFSQDNQSYDIDEDATAFYFALTANTGNPAHKFYYFITSKHSADKQKQHGGEPGFVVNTLEGSRRFITQRHPWYSHPTADNVDVSVTPIEHDPLLDVWPLHPAMFLRREMFEGFPDGFVGLGSEVFFPGLFQFVPGDKKVLPLVRHGNLAMIPDAPIYAYERFEDLYLIEARSLGGISGSPVFVRPMAQQEVTSSLDGITKYRSLTYLDLYQFLGMVRGHYGIKGDINQSNRTLSRDGVNMGIAMIVPCEKILEVLNHPDLLALRQQSEREYLDRPRRAVE